MAVLADRSRQWRPSSFSYRLLGGELRLDFPVVKLQDYAPHMDALLADPNPFALVTAAHLLMQQTKGKHHQRRRAKWRLTKLLYQRKWDKRRIIDFFNIIDWLMRLPEPLDTLFHRAIFQLERRATMVYITSVERYGLKKGLQEGREKGLQEGRQEGLQKGLQEGRLEGQLAQLLAQLEKRYGPLEKAVLERLAGADVRQLAQWALNFVDAGSLNEVFGD